MISDDEKKSDVSWLETYPFRKYVFPSQGEASELIFSRVKITGRLD